MKIEKSKIKIYIMLILIFFYALFDVMNSASSGNENSSRGIVYFFLFLIIGDMVLYFLFLKKKKIHRLEASMSIYSIFLILYNIILKSSIGWNQFILIMLSIWWGFTILYWRNIISNKEMIIIVDKFIDWMFIFYAIAIIYSSFNIVSNFSTEHARVGYIYHILALFPFILLKKESGKKQIYIFLTYILTFISLKRGAIIALPITHLCYLLIKKGNSIKKILKIVLSFLLLISIFLVFNDLTNGYLKNRFSVEEILDGSGRGEINENAIKNLKSRNMMQLFFGIKNKEEIILDSGIHNEFLSQLYSYGILGVGLYFNIYLNLLIMGIELIKKEGDLKPSFCSMYIYILLLGTVSGVYFVHSTYYLMMYIGYIYAYVKIERKK